MFEIHKADHAVFIWALFLLGKLSCRFCASILEPAKFFLADALLSLEATSGSPGLEATSGSAGLQPTASPSGL